MTKRNFGLLVLVAAVIVVAALVSGSAVVSAQNANTATPAPAKTKKKPAKHKVKSMGRCDKDKQEQPDLSGTYTGKLKHGDEAPVDATLTITGTNFTVTAGSDTHSGRLSAETTCGYTAVTLMATEPPMIVSLRAKKVGDRLTLTSVPGEKVQVSFTPTGGSGGGRKHKAKSKSKKAAAPAAATQQ